MLASTNRILTTHTGSLPRPAALTDLYASRAEGKTIDEAALDARGAHASEASTHQWRCACCGCVAGEAGGKGAVCTVD